MDLQGYKIKGTTKCECGHEFVIKDMKKLQRINDDKFYGGVVRHVDEIKCPNCGKDTLLLIKQVGQTYIVKDIGQKEENQNKDIMETPKIDEGEGNITSNEIICPVCQKAFKNKAGLSIHMKTHENK